MIFFSRDKECVDSAYYDKVLAEVDQTVFNQITFDPKTVDQSAVDLDTVVQNADDQNAVDQNADDQNEVYQNSIDQAEMDQNTVYLRAGGQAGADQGLSLIHI